MSKQNELENLNKLIREYSDKYPDDVGKLYVTETVEYVIELINQMSNSDDKLEVKIDLF